MKEILDVFKNNSDLFKNQQSLPLGKSSDTLWTSRPNRTNCAPKFQQTLESVIADRSSAVIFD